MAMVVPLRKSCELPVAPLQGSLAPLPSQVIAHMGAGGSTWLTSWTRLCPTAIDHGPDRLRATRYLPAVDQGSETRGQRRAFTAPPGPWSA
jgi:hypothetical protein